MNGGKPANVGPYLAISRESGCGGSQIAGWPAKDRLGGSRSRASRMPGGAIPRLSAVLGLVDETTAKGITEIFGNGIDPDYVSQTPYLFHLGRVIDGRRAGKSSTSARCAFPFAAPARFDRSAGRLARISRAADCGPPALELRQGPRLCGKDGRRPARVCPTILSLRHCRSAPVRLDGQRRTDRATTHFELIADALASCLRCASVTLKDGK